MATLNRAEECRHALGGTEVNAPGTVDAVFPRRRERYRPPNGAAPLQDDPSEASQPQGVDPQPLLPVPVAGAPGAVVDIAILHSGLQQAGELTQLS